MTLGCCRSMPPAWRFPFTPQPHATPCQKVQVRAQANPEQSNFRPVMIWICPRLSNPVIAVLPECRQEYPPNGSQTQRIIHRGSMFPLRGRNSAHIIVLRRFDPPHPRTCYPDPSKRSGLHVKHIPSDLTRLLKVVARTREVAPKNPGPATEP